MKKLLFLMLGVALFSCTQQKGFKIDVMLEGAEGQILLEERGPSAWIAVDTAEVVDGVAVFEGETKYPKEYFLSVLGERAKAMVFVENAVITVSGKVDSLNDVSVSGSLTHDEYASVNSQLEPLVASYMDPYQESRAAQATGDTATANQLMAKAQDLYDAAAEKMEEVQVDFIKENPASYYAPSILNQLQHGMEVDELEKVVNSLDAKLDSVQTVVTLKEKIEKLKTVAVGQIAPDFTQNDVDGNPVKFSDIYSKNELTLVDFWASWCGPCRQENPHVVATYTQFKDKGFSVFGVSLDRDKAAWVKAIADDNLTWDHVSDLAYWNNAAAKLYAISSVPSSLLVDKTGKIIAKNKRGEELSKTVEEFFK